MGQDGDPEDEQRLLNFGTPVDDPDFCELMRGRLYELLRSTSSPRIFPGGQPVSFESRHLQTLETEDFYVCEKSDGIRYLLYFCRPPSGPAAFLIDRNYEFRYLGELEVPLKDDTGTHEETLLDGELIIDTIVVKNKEKTVDIYELDEASEEKEAVEKKIYYMIFDCLLMNTDNVLSQSLPSRLRHVQNDFLSPFVKHNMKSTFPFDIQLKTMYKPYHMQHLFREVIPNLHHGNDGLIFTPVEDYYQSGTCQRMLKWKPAHLNSVDFKIASIDEADLYMLQVAQSGTHRDYTNFRPEPDDANKWKEAPPIGRIIECRYDPDWLVDELKPDEKGGWRFLRFREDKNTANAMHVVQKIINSINDNVKETQLIKSCDRIKKNWELRHPEEARVKRPKTH